MIKFISTLKKYLPHKLFTKSQLKKFALIGLAPLLLFLIAYIPIKAVLNHRAIVALDEENAFLAESSKALVEMPNVGDFKPIGDFLNFSHSLLPVRQANYHWSKEDINKFWVDPKSLNIATLPESNQEFLLNYLDTQLNDGN